MSQALPCSISVVIPLYNKRATIGRAIESVLNQPEANPEIIVVDDGSTDGSGDIVKGYGGVVRLIPQENSGPSAARNRGVLESQGRTIAFLDADDELLPGCLSAHLEARARRSNVFLSFAPTRFLENGVFERDDLVLPRASAVVSDGSFSYTTSFSANLIKTASSSICIDRTLFDCIGGFDIRLHSWEISDFNFRALLTCPSVAILNRILVIIHHDVSNSQGTRTNTLPLYRSILLARFISKLVDVPASEVAPLLQIIRTHAEDLLEEEHFSSFRQATRAAAQWRSVDPEFAKLYLLSLLPDDAIRCILSGKRMARRAKAMVHAFSLSSRNAITGM